MASIKSIQSGARGFAIAVAIHSVDGSLWELYGISIALTIRSVDRSLSTHLITPYPVA